MGERASKSSKVVAMELSAPVSDREKDRLSHFLEGKIAESGRIRVLLLLGNYPPRDTSEALLEDLSFIKLHADHIEKMAVVGERAWQETWVALFGLFGGLEAAYFDRSEKDEAATWLES